MTFSLTALCWIDGFTLSESTVVVENHLRMEDVHCHVWFSEGKLASSVFTIYRGCLCNLQTIIHHKLCCCLGWTLSGSFRFICWYLFCGLQVMANVHLTMWQRKSVPAMYWEERPARQLVSTSSHLSMRPLNGWYMVIPGENPTLLPARY